MIPRAQPGANNKKVIKLKKTPGKRPPVGKKGAGQVKLDTQEGDVGEAQAVEAVQSRLENLNISKPAEDAGAGSSVVETFSTVKPNAKSQVEQDEAA